MSNRDLYLEDAAALKERLKTLPAAPPDIDAFIPGERARIQSLPDAELVAEWEAAWAIWFKREQEKRHLELLSDRYVTYRGTLGQEIIRVQELAKKETPPVLVEAIDRMRREISDRQMWGKRQGTFSHVPGGTLVIDASHRTPAHDRAQLRAEQALTKLEALATVPGDLAPKVKAILDAMHSADMADLSDFTPPERKLPRKREAVTEAVLEV